MPENTPSCSVPRKLTEFRHLNVFSTDVAGPRGSHTWLFTSRKAEPGADPERPDAVVIVALVESGGEYRLVLTREFRAPLGRFEYSVPSGLVDAGETILEAAKRELHEETGLLLGRVAHVSPAVASSAGLTDETVSLVYAEASGELSTAHLDGHENIETRLAGIDDLRQLLRSPAAEIISSRVYPVLVAYVTAGAITLPTV
jgi:ADP-ribose pyrophosphatase